ncbi:LuxR C-terminal-related transcriptional regulator [Flavobacterium sp. AC]|uniref:LuxR C-terminal-related transcriptional regulator n=1 Tax=Flavobacterium azizsancarii TaxID=2961580 RepID=A0ABT4WF86_9FLAO|nr:triple tyrosine motif-containing protein [Flavobacterium azizsancarii]MDA6071234.1 LuxR C-terminal-related transcriptional regulator [Flavobacterium azizsancarii]
MKFINSILIPFIYIFLHTPVCAQVKGIGIPSIKNYKRSDYRGGTQNWSIDQDKNGNMYFANNNGLIQFDGTSWHKYSLPSQNEIRSLKIDSSGKIFVGGNNEFGYFQNDTKGILKYHSLSDMIDKKDKQNINLIWRIHLFNGEVIFQSFTKVFFLKNNKLRFINAPSKFQFSFLVNNRLYFQDKSLGILEYKNKKLKQIQGTTFFNDKEIWSVFPLPNNKMLLATLEKGLFISDNTTVKPWETEANAFIKKNTSLGGSMIKGKFIVLNSVLDGVIVCDLNGKIIQHLNRQKGLQNNTILTSFIDNKDNIWLGLDNGITFVNENSPFSYFDYSYNIGTVYASTVFNGNLYVATNQGLFYHSWNTPFKDSPFTRVEGTISQAWNIQVINNVLICASNSGALVIDHNKVSKKLDSRGYFGFKTIPNHEGYIIGESYNGFSIFKKSADGFEYSHQVAGFDETTNTFSIELDQDYLWLKKDPFLYQMKLSGDLKKFDYIKKHKNISGAYTGIGSLQNINNIVYFQTKNHFFRFSREQGTFFEDKKITALFNGIPAITTLIEDSQGNLWYAHNESLGVLTKNQNGTFTKKQAPFSNLSGNLVNNYISVNTIDPENIFIGQTDGLTHYDSKFPNSFITKPKVFIESFTFPGDTILTGNIPENHQIYTVPYSSNHVKFTFSSPTYENQENVTYSYKLEPFEENWRAWSTLSIKEYTNLREGTYAMKLKAKNSYGVESNISEITFTVSPPWYRHFLAYLVYFILLITAIYIISNRIKLKIRKNRYYETIEQRRLYLEKESKIRHEQHELEKEIEKLKNDKLQIKILAKDKELVNNSLQVVKKNKILNGIIYKLKDIDTNILDDSTKFEFNKLHKSIVKEVNTDKSWKDLEKHIKNVHFEFLKRLKEKYPTISPRELDLSTYLLMNMSTKEIAEIMNISTGGVELARYRLRKKLGLNKKENLIGFLMSI